MKSSKSEGVPVKRELSTEEVQDAQIGLLEWELEEHGKDPLTGVSTRKAFENELERALRAIRSEGEGHHRSSGEPLKEVSVIFIDLDNFKAVNDNYDHSEGDQVLKNVAKVLTNSVRESDVVGRYGGDEFFILLPRASNKVAETISHKILDNIKSDPDLSRHNITASIGVCSSRVSTYPAQLVNLADIAAKKAKQNGKDSVVLHNEQVYT